MATTYTQNLNLGLQLDKTDYVNWDLIQQNWRKIDEAVGGVPAPVGSATLLSGGVNRSIAGIANVDAPTYIDGLDYTWEQGGTRNNFDGDSTTALRCNDYFDVWEGSIGVMVTLSGTDSALKYCVFEYGSGHTGIWTSPWIDSSESYTFHSGCTSIRLLVSKEGGGTIDVDNMSACIIEFF